MKKNNTFDLGRFGKYLIYDLNNCRINFGISMIILILMGIITYFLTGISSVVFLGKWVSTPIMGRIPILGLSILIMAIAMPSKCYGFLTDKGLGSQWLMLPASKLEKFLSMMIMTLIVVPFLTIGGFLLCDWLLCIIDSNCGQSIVSAACNIMSLGEIATEELAPLFPFIENKWILYDEMPQMILPFVLGAIIFKRNKSAKTILCLIMIGIIFGLVGTPLLFNSVLDGSLVCSSDEEAIETITSIGNNLILVDTISDSIINIGLLVAIYLRINHLKH